ncbi:hypothetical protein ACC684_10035 [Rhizobium ruizarguesonis]
MTDRLVDAKFFIENNDCARSFNDFVDWTYTHMDVPVVRGAVIEYLVVQHLLDNAEAIAGDRIKTLTGSRPSQAQLMTSLEPIYGAQPHGDLFDLQLHWGVTVEIKSTTSRTNWRMSKTEDWNLWTGKSSKAKNFQAQYYILAEMGNDSIVRHELNVNIENIKFFVLSGRELDVRSKKKSIGFNAFTKGIGPCKIGQLADRLKAVVDSEYTNLSDILIEGWSIPSPNEVPSKGELLVPFAVQDGSNFSCAWFRGVVGKWRKVCDIPTPWKNPVQAGARDWATIGLIHVKK